MIGSVPSSSEVYDLPGFRVPVLLIEHEVSDALHRRRPSAFGANLRKESGQSDEVVAFPLFGRMIVAAGAFQTNSQKYLGSDGNQILRRPREVIDRTRVPRTAGRGQQFTHELVVGLIAAEGLPQPVLQVAVPS